MAWDELIDSGLGEKLDLVVEDNGIRVTAEGIIADDLNTLILLKVEDLNGDTTFSDDPYIIGKYYEPEEVLDEVEYIEASGDIKKYDGNSLPLTTSNSLYQEEEGINKIIITTDAMDKEEGYINLKIREFKGINKEPMEIVKGNWDMEIEAKKLESYSYPIDEKVVVDGNEIKINNIIIAPTETKIEYEFKTYNEEKDYYLKGLNFSIKYDGKIYESSKLGHSFINDFMTSDLTKIEASSLETLYLEKPYEIELILNQYRYNTKNKISYSLDVDNLPQELEYGDSRLILEDIIYTDDSIELIVKEDDSRGRKYLNTNMVVHYEVINDNNHKTHSTHSIYYVRDSSEKTERQNILIHKDFVIRDLNIKESNKSSEIIIRPTQITIEGQEYVENPNKKLKINLK